VSGLAIDTGHVFLPDGTTLATTAIPGDAPAVELAVLPKGAGFPTFVRFWRLDGARLRALCVRGPRIRLRLAGPSAGPSGFLDLPATRARLAGAMDAAGIHLGELAQGRCLEAGS
jgi:hypothetical protein